MFVDDEGWLNNEDGDTAKVIKMPRSSDGGPLTTPNQKPLIFIHHSTGTIAPEGADTSDRDGTDGMAKRVASGERKFWAHVYLSRDGKAYQHTPFTRVALATEGRFKKQIPPEATGQVNNKIAAQMEWTGWGGSQELATASMPKSKPAWSKVKLKDRKDMVKVGYTYWQIPTVVQAKAGAEITQAVVKWSGMVPEAAFYGHHEVGSGAHGDPGKVIYGALDVLARPAVGLQPQIAVNLFPYQAGAAMAGMQLLALDGLCEIPLPLLKPPCPGQYAAVSAGASWLLALFLKGLFGHRG